MTVLTIIPHLTGIDNGGGTDYNSRMDKKTRNWILVFTVFCAVCLLLFALLKLNGRGAKIAEISVDGTVIETIDLSRVKEPYDIPIDTQYGHNTVHVERGAISVTEADCPDQICVAMGKLDGSGIPIICMPHRLVILVEGDEIDA